MVGSAELRKPLWWLVGVLILASAAVLLYSWRTSRQTQHPAAVKATPTPPVATEPAIQNPVPAPSGPSTAPLPTLAQSDAPMQQALTGVMGAQPVQQLVRPEMIVRHVVATVDNLSRKRAAVQLWPVKPVPGQFMIHGDDQHATIDPANYQRYTAYVQVLQMVDTKQLADLYFHYYPLFQQAYQNLGYPNGYFNDRLVETIDNLLQAPDVKGDVALVRPNVMYQYADPNLESLSAGQKALLRMGPDNEAAVKAKLRELKAAVTDRSRGAPAGTRDRDGNATQ
jgi:Protein of unknown function (DUF3014)